MGKLGRRNNQFEHVDPEQADEVSGETLKADYVTGTRRVQTAW